MGSLPIQRLSDNDIVSLYLDGKSQAWLGLKARLSSARIREILVANGVRIRQSPEALRLSLRTRKYVPNRPSRPVYKAGDAGC